MCEYTTDWRDHKEQIRDHIKSYQRLGLFSWPDDGLSGEPWHYLFHWEWVSAWNREDRTTPVIEFILAFLDNCPADPPHDNPLSVFEDTNGHK